MSNKDDILDRWQEYVKEVSIIIHYPDCWDTVAYPSLRDALKEIAGCAGCSECKYAGKNPDADQKPIEQEYVLLNTDDVECAAEYAGIEPERLFAAMKFYNERAAYLKRNKIEGGS